MSATSVCGNVGKRKTIPMNDIHRTEIAATGILCGGVSWYAYHWISDNKTTHKSAKSEWSRLEIIFEDKTSCDWNCVCDVKRYYAQAEYRICCWWPRKSKKTEKEREDGDIDDCVDRRLCIIVHVVKPARERESTISSKSEGLSGRWEELRIYQYAIGFRIAWRDGFLPY